jgi:UDP-N-acetyl-D-galactosamine dehydrogenase
VPHQRRISVIGLGYVGLPVAVAFGRQDEVVGFDIDGGRIAELREGRDRTGEVGCEALNSTSIRLTCDPADLRSADFHIVTVPTPVDSDRKPDLGALQSASRLLGEQLKAGDIVVYESTVYPGVTEEVCLPILESASGLRGGQDFSVGYSPERINPGDREHTFTDITKVVAGQDPHTREVIAAVYGSVVKAGIYLAPDIRTAEAAKVIENTQRDLNIALINELSMLFNRMGLDTQEVLAAARTKWNFLPFVPGLVGGHCIGVDPYYLTYKAEQIGYHPEVILAGRRINDALGRFVAEECASRLARNGVTLKGSRVTVLGLTFKEDVPDLRNSKVIDVIRGLETFGVQVQTHDPLAASEDARREYGVELLPLEGLAGADAVVVAVAHRPYREGGWPLVMRLLGETGGMVADLKAMLPREDCPQGVHLWRL